MENVIMTTTLESILVFALTTPAQINLFTGVLCVEEWASVMGMWTYVGKISNVLLFMEMSPNAQCQLLLTQATEGRVEADFIFDGLVANDGAYDNIDPSDEDIAQLDDSGRP